MILKSNDLVDKMTLGVRLQQCRDKKKLSAVEAAKQIGVAYKTLERHEQGKAYPQLDAFYKYCKFYDVSPWEFMEGIPWKYRKCKPGKRVTLMLIAGRVPQCILPMIDEIKAVIRRMAPDSDIQVLSDREWLESQIHEEGGNAHETH